MGVIGCTLHDSRESVKVEVGVRWRRVICLVSYTDVYGSMIARCCVCEAEYDASSASILCTAVLSIHRLSAQLTPFLSKLSACLLVSCSRVQLHFNIYIPIPLNTGDKLERAYHTPVETN